MERPKSGLVTSDGVARCWWAEADPLYRAYHDEEWGFPVADDQRLFEKICLEGFQSGLAWITILRKRDAFRAAFKNFDIDAVSRMNQRSVDRLLRDAGIVRHRGKIESTLNNARRTRELISAYGSLAAWCWNHEPEARTRPRKVTLAAVSKMTSTPESLVLSRNLKARGFTFVGPTTSYAFMQAMGLVNDHIEGCAARPRAEAARRRFRRPKIKTESRTRTRGAD